MQNKSSFALVTGASSGIGLRYATILARDYGYSVLLVSNQEKELHDAAEHIAQTYQVQTRTLCLNLATTDAAEQVYAFCQTEQIDVEVLINNAGMLIFNPLCQTPTEKIETIILLHTLTMTKLCQLFGAKMLERLPEHGHRGYILNMSSMSAWMAMPGIQCYNATKSYVLNFSKSLWYEMHHAGVHVLALTPGSTDTGLLPFTPKFGKFLRTMGITMSPERLVTRGLHVLFHSSRKRCMPGAWNYLIVPIINHLPDWLVFWAMTFFPMFQAPKDKK